MRIYVVNSRYDRYRTDNALRPQILPFGVRRHPYLISLADGAQFDSPRLDRVTSVLRILGEIRLAAASNKMEIDSVQD